MPRRRGSSTCPRTAGSESLRSSGSDSIRPARPCGLPSPYSRPTGMSSSSTSETCRHFSPARKASGPRRPAPEDSGSLTRASGDARQPGCDPGGADGGAAQDRVTVVHDGGLALGHAARRVVQADAQLVSVQPGGAGVDFAVGAELHEALSRLGRRGAAGPDRAGGGDLGDVEALGGADGDRSGYRLDIEDVAGSAVVGGGAHAQAAALADGEGVGAVVLADDGA